MENVKYQTTTYRARIGSKDFLVTSKTPLQVSDVQKQKANERLYHIFSKYI